MPFLVLLRISVQFHYPHSGLLPAAHAKDGWSFGSGHPAQQAWVGAKTDEQKSEYDKWDVMQPKSTEERVNVAKAWMDDLKPQSPYYCDPIDNNARFAFEAVPERLYIIENGKVVYRGGEGPFGYKTEEVGDWLAARFPGMPPPPPKPGQQKPAGVSPTAKFLCAGAAVAAAAAAVVAYRTQKP